MEAVPFNYGHLADVTNKHNLQGLWHAILKSTYAVGGGQLTFAQAEGEFEPHVRLVQGEHSLQLSCELSTEQELSDFPNSDGLPAEVGALLWAAKNDAVIQLFRQWTQRDLNVEPPQSHSDLEGSTFTWRWRSADVAYAGKVWLSESFLNASIASPAIAKDNFELPFSFLLQIHAKTNPVLTSTLQSMRCGDVLLVSRANAFIPVDLSLANFSATGVLDLTHRDVHIKTEFKERIMNTDVTIQPQQAEETSAESKKPLDSLKVQLGIEFAQLSVDLKTVSEFSTGDVLPLERLAEDDLVHLVSGNDRIASGKLVRVGERLGVQLTDVY